MIVASSIILFHFTFLWIHYDPNLLVDDVLAILLVLVVGTSEQRDRARLDPRQPECAMDDLLLVIDIGDDFKNLTFLVQLHVPDVADFDDQPSDTPGGIVGFCAVVMAGTTAIDGLHHRFATASVQFDNGCNHLVWHVVRITENLLRGHDSTIAAIVPVTFHGTFVEILDRRVNCGVTFLLASVHVDGTVIDDMHDGGCGTGEWVPLAVPNSVRDS